MGIFLKHINKRLFCFGVLVSKVHPYMYKKYTCHYVYCIMAFYCPKLEYKLLSIEGEINTICLFLQWDIIQYLKDTKFARNSWFDHGILREKIHNETLTV